MCDRVGVLYAGRLVEQGPVDEVFNDPRHPYTVGLLRCLPARRRAQGPAAARHDPRLPAAARRRPPGVRVRRSLRAGPGGLLARRSRRSTTSAAAHNSRCHFWEQAHELPRATPASAAFKPVDQSAEPGDPRGEPAQDLPPGGPRHPRRGRPRTSSCARARRSGLVGESGSGKTTLARDAARAHPRPTRARSSSSTASRSRRRSASAAATSVRALQIVFQNPDSALNRRFSVQRILGRALDEAAAATPAREREEHLRELAHSRPLRHAADPRRARRSSRAGSSSAWRSPARSPASRASWSATSRPRRSTSRSRRRSSTCWRSCRPTRASPTCSSRTTSASCATCPTASPCSTSGG